VISTPHDYPAVSGHTILVQLLLAGVDFFEFKTINVLEKSYCLETSFFNVLIILEKQSVIDNQEIGMKGVYR